MSMLPNKAERPIAHLAGFRGILSVNGYSGYKMLAERSEVRLTCLTMSRQRHSSTHLTATSDALQR